MRDYGLSPERQDELWQRWRRGESLTAIARSIGAPLHHLRRFLAQTGRIRPAPARHAPRHLTFTEGEEISRGLAAGSSAQAIARRLQRAASTVSREIARNGGREHYRAQHAQVHAHQCARRPKRAKLATHPKLRRLVEAKLALRWSPEQISGWLRRCFPDDGGMRICQETIYRSLFDPRHQAINRTGTRWLRTGRPMRYPRAIRRRDGRGRLRDMLSIGARPAEVQERLVAGHWEGDLLMGARPSAIATLVERTSRYVLLVALPDGLKTQQVRPHLTRVVSGLPVAVRRSLTWDRGREMAEHRLLTAATGMPVYFCHRRSPWQRGSNENSNGLLRQYLAKSADLRTFTQADLDAIATELNDRPRKLHGFRSPTEVYADLVKAGGALTP
ncbi:IS30 family transposase [Planobispora siamensis]|nr:IS30 family transposase [Planobispora siamensis]